MVILIIACLVFAAAFLFQERRERYVPAVVLKGLASVCFVILGILFSPGTLLAKRIVCGLILGAGSLASDAAYQAVITLTELIAGYIFNIKMHMKVWDYSRQPLNFHGQICPLYSALWAVLTIPILALCGLISRKLEL